jgi:hypothetical protein
MSVSTSTPGTSSRSGRRIGADLAIAVERGERDAAHPPDLEPPFERGLGIVGLQPDVLPLRVHPQLTTRLLADRRGEAVMIGVRVRADHQLHVFDPEPRLRQRDIQHP